MDRVTTAIALGVSGMVVGKATNEPVPRYDVMQSDVLMGLGGEYYLTVAGLLVIFGSIAAMYGGFVSYKRSKEQKRRESDNG